MLRLIRQHAPITGEQLAEMVGVSRPTLRSDLALLVMLGLAEAKPKVGYFPGKRPYPDRRGVPDPADVRVDEVMGVPAVVRETASVNDAVVALFTQDVGSLTVVDETGDLAGVVSRKDLLKVLVGGPQGAQLPVSVVMTRRPHVVVARPEERLLDAARKMILHQIDGMPVVRPASGDGENGRLEVVGRVTKTTVVKVFVETIGAPGQEAP